MNENPKNPRRTSESEKRPKKKRQLPKTTTSCFLSPCTAIQLPPSDDPRPPLELEEADYQSRLELLSFSHRRIFQLAVEDLNVIVTIHRHTLRVR